MKYDNKTRTKQTFTLTGTEHTGAKGANRRLVCFVKDDQGLLAIWGTIGINTGHIHEVEQAGFPVTIECDWIEPDDYEASRFGHRYWVPETAYLKVL